MRLPIWLALLASLTGFTTTLPAADSTPVATHARAQASPAMDVPWGMPNDTSPAFSPDGQSVTFARGRGAARRIYVSRRADGGWSEPQLASFSNGDWMDMEPSMAPDGSFLVFATNRPALPSGKALDGAYEGQSQPGRGGNVWRVNRAANGWTAPERLPDAVNAGTSVYAPAVAGDGSLYFMKPDTATNHFRLYVSHVAQGRYQAPLPMPFSDGQVSDYDPAIAPDRSFIVFSSDRAPSTATDSAIFVAFAAKDGWSTPVPLGISGTESRLSPDLATLYFNGADKRIHRFALGEWFKRYAMRR